MDIKIPDKWLREYLETKATPQKLAECLSLCGESVEKIEKIGNETVYDIEITTNRVDSASVLGIAREASAILPRFKIPAKFTQPMTHAKQRTFSSVNYLKTNIDHNLCFRFSAILIKNIKIATSPLDIQNKLIESGARPINNIVDISNYIMFLFGQPIHTFDYDKIKGAKMHLRASRKGEELTTLDGKKHKLPGGDIVIEDVDGRLIDLAGIMGGLNSAVDENTKNVLLFVQTYNPVNIRRTSMALAARSQASILFEKGLDTELVDPALRYGIDMFVNLTKGTPADEILDIYPDPYKVKAVKTNLEFINERLGISLTKDQISKSLVPLGFYPRWSGKNISVEIPSYRRDVEIPEDIVEEVARIYGYRNLPDTPLSGVVPIPINDSPFIFEEKVKDFLSGWGGVEVYTQSLVPKELAGPEALKLKNPLGKEAEYLRTSLMLSLEKAARENSGVTEPFHLFEIANVYLPRRGDLPVELMTLAGVFVNDSYENAKGIIEALLEKLNIDYKFVPEDSKGFLPSQRLSIKTGQTEIGQFGVLESGLIYYEFPIESLQKASKEQRSFVPIPNFPSQIEDITLSFPAKTYLGDVIEKMKSADKLISEVKLVDKFKDFFTFRIWYQHPTKTLTDREVEKIRNRLVETIKRQFGGFLKD